MTEPTSTSAEELSAPNGDLLEGRIRPTDIRPPTVSRPRVLPFQELPWEHFEHLCARLISQDADIEASHVYGSQGEAQAGVDIVAIPKDATAPRHSLYQCKRVDRFGPRDLRQAVAKFQQGRLIANAQEFVLVYSCATKASVIDAYMEERRKLSKKGVELLLWDESELSRKLEIHPELVERFFGVAWVQAFCASIPCPASTTTVSGSNDSRLGLSNQAKWAEFVARANQRQGRGVPWERRQESNGRQFLLQNEEVLLDASLPAPKDCRSFCSIRFRQPDIAGVDIALEHQEILGVLFTGIGYSPLSPLRRFVLTEPKPPSGWVRIRLAGGLLTVGVAAQEMLCEAVDKLHAAFLPALRSLDAAWESAGFPFVEEDGAVSIEIGSVPVWLWREMIRFAYRFDFASGKSPWHIFDAAPSLFKVYTPEHTKILDKGFHLFLRPDRSDLALAGPHETVRLLWVPPEESDIPDPIAQGRRCYWGCDTTERWLRQAFFPELARDLDIRAPSTLKNEVFGPGKAADWQSEIELAFLSSQTEYLSPLTDAEMDLQALAKIVDSLQLFIHSHGYPTWPDKLRRAAYGAVQIALRCTDMKSSCLGYVCEKLHATDANTKDTLLAVLRTRLSEGVEEIDRLSMDCAFRALASILDEKQTHLDRAELARIAGILLPFIDLHDTALMIRNHAGQAEVW